MKRLTAAAMLVLLTMTGCGGDDGTPPAAQQTPGELRSGKPAVNVPAGPAPTSLVVEDLIQGTGAEAKPGTTVSVHYVGVSFSDRQEFDSSWGGEPFELQLPGNVIAGWNEGIPGMKVGGRRKLVIPPDKGYGAQGNGPIKPNETLVFVIDLLAVK